MKALQDRRSPPGGPAGRVSIDGRIVWQAIGAVLLTLFLLWAIRRRRFSMVLVNVDNYVRAETARMFDGVLAQSGGVNRWLHTRMPTPIDAQTVIRMNRDTLYSAPIVDISQGTLLTMPDPGSRYMSMMVINEDHFINRVFHGAGTHELTVDDFDTPYVGVALRTLVDPDDPDDLEAVRSLQDALVLDTGSANPYTHPDYEDESLRRSGNQRSAMKRGRDDG